MRLNSKVTWGLAWTGLAIVLAVPSADFLTNRLNGNSAAVITSTTDPVKPATGATSAPVKTASVTTTRTKTGVIITPNTTGGTTAPTAPVVGPVSKFQQSGKPLPDYISDGDQAASITTPATAASSAPETQVANVAPAQVAPMPLPRPAAIDKTVTTPKPAATDPVVTGALPKAAQPAGPLIVPRQSTAPVVIVEDDPAPVQQAGIAPDHPVPPAAIEDDSRNWRAQGLAKYLDQNGLMSDDSQSTAIITVQRQPSADYDSDGFYLDQGPNRDQSWRAARRAKLERMLRDRGDDGGFQLF